MAAVPIDEAGILAVEVEGLSDASVGKQRESGVLLIKERIAGGQGRPLKEEVPAAVQPLGVETGGQGEGIVAGLGPVRVEAKLPGVVTRAQEPGVLPGPGERALDQADRQGHAARHAVTPAPKAVEHGRITREIVPRGDPIEIIRPARVRGMAGQHAMNSHQVVSLGMRHRADDRQLASPRRQAR